jgi:hypothetical protein
VEITMLASDTSNTPATTNAHERLTWGEICQRHPDQWVVLVEFQRVDEMDDADDVPVELCTAMVIAHHKTRKAASPDVKAALQHGKEAGSFFTGRLIPPPYEILVP